MSTRCMINFCHGDEIVAKVYRHCDGYPGEHGVDADLAKFFDAVAKQAPYDTRFNDPEYLAARFIVWSALGNAKHSASLDFLGIGVAQHDHGDVAYLWFVDCSQGDRHGNGKRPTVRHESTR